MVVALQQLLNCYVGETLNSFALLIFKGSTTLGAFFFIAERETTAVCHHSCPCIHPLLGFCWDQTDADFPMTPAALLTEHGGLRRMIRLLTCMCKRSGHAAFYIAYIDWMYTLYESTLI